MSELDVSEYSLLVKEGYLFKQSSSYLKQWKSKWIVLKGFCILIFNQKPIDHRTNDVLEIYDLTIYDNIKMLMPSIKNNSFEFELFSSSNNTKQSPPTKFKANSNKDMIEWINDIQKQINKISINDTITDNDYDHYDDNVLTSVSQLIDDGFTANETSMALKISINENNDDSSSDDDDQNGLPLTASFDPRSMFESTDTGIPSQTDNGQTEKELKTALLSAIHETMDEKEVSNTSAFDCNDIIKDMNYRKISSSIQDILDITEDKDDKDDKEDKDDRDKITNNGIFELTSMNNKDNDADANINPSDLCILALKQLELLKSESNENLIQIKRMNLIETLNKIKKYDIKVYENMIKDNEWII